MDARILSLLSAACFGVNPIVLKLGLRDSTSDVAVFVGLVSGLPFLVLVAPALGGFQLGRLAGMAVFYFALGGLVGLFMGRTFQYLAIDWIGSARAASFKNSAPLFTAILALLFLQESVGLGRWLAIALVTAGLTLIGHMARRQVKTVTLLGLLVAVSAALFYGIRPVFVKLGLNLSPLPLAATLVGYLTAIVLFLLFFLLTGRVKPRATPRSLLFFAIGGILQTFGMLLLFYALQAEEVSIIYPISASAPLLTFVLSWAVLRNRERLTRWDLGGTLSVITGVVLLLR